MNRIMNTVSRTVLLSALPFIVSDVVAATDPPRDLDSFVENVRQKFEVPGIGLAIVKDGEVVVAKGYGLSDMERSTLVDAHTLFAIASNTKAFTATALALLVEDGKLRWDDPVIDHLPWFQLSDPYVTREITVKDLLVHRSGLGLGQGDLMIFPPTDFDRLEIVRRLRFLELKTSFRSAYAYDNVLYVVAGDLIAAVSGQSWEEFIDSRILNKCGMTDTKTRIEQVIAATNVAQPYMLVDQKLMKVDHEAVPNNAPACGIYSSASDMAKWLAVQLDSGRVVGSGQIFSVSTTRELWAYVTPIPIADPPPELARFRRQFLGYGLGLAVGDYRGQKVVFHDGVLGGYVSMLTMIPDLKLGIVILTNQMSEYGNIAITRHIIDHYLDVSDMNWLATMEAVATRDHARISEKEQQIMAARNASTQPSLPISSYVGIYSDVWYGDITIVQEEGKLVMRFSHTPTLVGDLEHWQYDSFVVRWRNLAWSADAFVTFSLNPDGTIEQAKMKAVSPATDFSFDFQDLLLKPKPDKGE